MMRKASGLLAAAALVLGLHSAAWAAAPGVIPYQGRLTDAAGNAVSGNQSIVFSLFTVASAGSAVWTETQPTVAVANGLFSVDLGSVTAIPTSIFTGGDLYLEIKVGADPPMTPRQRLGSTAYAFRAGVAPGIANSVGGTIAMASGDQNLTSVTATFPTAGIAFVVGNLEAFAFIPASTTNCVGLSISDVSGASVSGGINYQCPTAGPAQEYHEGNTTVTRVFSVAAGAKTFYLVGQEQSGSWTAFRSRLTVMFFPDVVGPTSVTPEPQNAPAGSHPVGNSGR